MSKRKLAYVTDLERRLSGGGSYAVNWHAADQLAKRFDVAYAGPITPKTPAIAGTISKVQRHVFKRPGRFAYFSAATLDRNASMVAEHLSSDLDAVVFRSSARWSRVRPTVPYFVYLDAVFHTFFHNTFDPSLFDAADINRIWEEEAAFLEGASGVFFESEWGLRNARSAYNLQGTHYYAPGRGGVIDPPSEDTWTPGSHALVSIAMNFQQKGGDIVMDAYRSLKPRFPSLEWHVIGAPPDGDRQSIDGITHEGVLDPDNASGRARLVRVLSKAFAIVHPTREDTSPLVLTEAAYFGCPAISVNRFAIPELVADGVTGILVDPPASPNDVAEAIASLLEDPDRYAKMRADTRARALERYSWNFVGGFICDRIDERIA